MPRPPPTSEAAEMPEVMMVSDVCKMLKCGRALVYTRIDEKKITGVRLTPCGAWRIERASVLRHLKTLGLFSELLAKKPQRDYRRALASLVAAGVEPPQTLVDRVHGRRCERHA